jgi:hypothetical protein
MTVSHLDCSMETLTLPHENPLEHARLFGEWTTAYPYSTPIERGLIHQAAVALMEKRRIERVRATLRTQKVRAALLNWERAQEDDVATWLDRFNASPGSALVGLLRSASGCRWAIATWERLAQELRDEGTWYGGSRLDAVQIQGKSACIEHLHYSLEAFTTWADSVACQANPKQKDINVILDRKNIPKALQEKDVQVWPRDPAACRARLQALVDRELPRLRAIEATLRTQYEEPERAEAEEMALASLTSEEASLLRAERAHEQSFLRAATALLNVRKQTGASRSVPTAGELAETALDLRPEPQPA